MEPDPNRILAGHTFIYCHGKPNAECHPNTDPERHTECVAHADSIIDKHRFSVNYSQSISDQFSGLYAVLLPNGDSDVYAVVDADPDTVKIP